MSKNQNSYIQYLFVATAIATFGVSFDGFWHLTRGRESFFVLAHIFVYLGIFSGIYISFKAFGKFKTSIWKWILRLLCIIPLIAPIDEIWHRLYGKEVVESVRIIWSLPHVLILITASTIVFLVSALISTAERLKNRIIIGPMALGMFLNALMMFLVPFFPASPHHIFGSAGLGASAAAMVITYLLSRRMFPDSGSATLAAFTCVVMQMIIFDSTLYIPAEHNFFKLPDWTLFLVFLTPAIIIDLSDSWYAPSRGMLAGLVLGAIFFWLGSWAPDSTYVYADLWSGTITAAIGGIFAGVAYEHLIPNKKTA